MLDYILDLFEDITFGSVALFLIIAYVIGVVGYTLWNYIGEKWKRLKAVDSEEQELKLKKNEFEKEKIDFEKSRNEYYTRIKETEVYISEQKNQLYLTENKLYATIKEKEDSVTKREKELEANKKLLLSNIKSLPYMASIIADYETRGLEILAKSLSWGNSVERAKKVASIRELRTKTKELVQQNMYAKYQLEYLIQLYPNLTEILDTEYEELPKIDFNEISDYDRTKDWLSKEEYRNLSTIERNQLALDRYRASHRKTKWQIGRDYETYVGYLFESNGYDVDYFGSYMNLEDLGRDIIAKKSGKTTIIQCKYWSQKKLIHEKHIMQLYGSIISYCIENNLPFDSVKGALVTNITLSETAKTVAKYLGISYRENIEMGEYPCIKCNIGHNAEGKTKIYHLPFDQQYDATKINGPDEFFAMTVKEAE